MRLLDPTDGETSIRMIDDFVTSQLKYCQLVNFPNPVTINNVFKWVGRKNLKLFGRRWWVEFRNWKILHDWEGLTLITNCNQTPNLAIIRDLWIGLWNQIGMEDKGITIIGSIITKVVSDEEFNILFPSHKNLDYLGLFSIDYLLGFIDKHKPESVTFYAAEMHGRSIIFVLEGLMRRKYKPFIYDYIIQKFGRPRIMIIKFVCCKWSNEFIRNTTFIIKVNKIVIRYWSS